MRLLSILLLRMLFMMDKAIGCRPASAIGGAKLGTFLRRSNQGGKGMDNSKETGLAYAEVGPEARLPFVEEFPFPDNRTRSKRA
jgi:hypothetical protein